MAQTVSPVVQLHRSRTFDRIVADHHCAPKHVQRARIILLSAERLPVQAVAPARRRCGDGSSVSSKTASMGCCATRHACPASHRCRRQPLLKSWRCKAIRIPVCAASSVCRLLGGSGGSTDFNHPLISACVKMPRQALACDTALANAVTSGASQHLDTPGVQVMPIQFVDEPAHLPGRPPKRTALAMLRTHPSLPKTVCKARANQGCTGGNGNEGIREMRRRSGGAVCFVRTNSITRFRLTLSPTGCWNPVRLHARDIATGELAGRQASRGRPCAADISRSGQQARCRPRRGACGEAGSVAKRGRGGAQVAGDGRVRCSGRCERDPLGEKPHRLGHRRRAGAVRSARITSKPLIVASAVFRVLQPRTGRISCLSLPCPAAMMVFRHLTCRCRVSAGHLPACFSPASRAASAPLNRPTPRPTGAASSRPSPCECGCPSSRPAAWRPSDWGSRRSCACLRGSAPCRTRSACDRCPCRG